MVWRDVLTQMLKKPATHWIYEPIHPNRIKMKEEETLIEPNKSYVRVKLKQMFLGYQRIWVQNRMPVVHAFPRFLHAQGYLEIPVIIGPNRLKNLEGQNVQRVVSLNQTVLGPVPYLGGDLELVIALFAAKTQNYADEFFDLLSSLSGILPGAELKTALGFLRPMEKGLENMLNLKDLTLQVGVQDTFSSPSSANVSNPLRSGYRVLIAKEQDDIDPKDLWLTERGLHLGKNGKPGELLTGCDYLVFQIEKLPARDWRELPTLSAAWEKVMDTVKISDGDEAIIDRAFKMFKWTLLGCGDLLSSQRCEVLNEQTNELRKILESGSIGLKSKGLFAESTEIRAEVAELLQNDIAVASKVRWQS